MRFAPAFALALGVIVIIGEAQRSSILTNGRNLQIPINHGLPDKPTRLHVLLPAVREHPPGEKVGWGDDYPRADFNG